MVMPRDVDVNIMMTGAGLEKQGQDWNLKKEEERSFGSSSGEL